MISLRETEGANYPARPNTKTVYRIALKYEDIYFEVVATEEDALKDMLYTLHKLLELTLNQNTQDLAYSFLSKTTEHGMSGIVLSNPTTFPNNKSLYFCAGEDDVFLNFDNFVTFVVYTYKMLKRILSKENVAETFTDVVKNFQ